MPYSHSNDSRPTAVATKKTKQFDGLRNLSVAATNGRRFHHRTSTGKDPKKSFTHFTFGGALAGGVETLSEYDMLADRTEIHWRPPAALGAIRLVRSFTAAATDRCIFMTTGRRPRCEHRMFGADKTYRGWGWQFDAFRYRLLRGRRNERN